MSEFICSGPEDGMIRISDKRGSTSAMVYVESGDVEWCQRLSENRQREAIQALDEFVAENKILIAGKKPEEKKETEKMSDTKYEHICAVCGKNFVNGGPRSKWCGLECKAKAKGGVGTTTEKRPYKRKAIMAPAATPVGITIPAVIKDLEARRDQLNSAIEQLKTLIGF